MPNPMFRVGLAEDGPYAGLLYPIREDSEDYSRLGSNQKAATWTQGSNTRKRSRLPVWLSWLEGRRMPEIKFDGTVNLGHILTIGTLVSMMAVAYATYKVSMNDHDSRLTFLENQMKSQDAYNVSTSSTLYSIKQDVAIIKDRLEKPK